MMTVTYNKQMVSPCLKYNNNVITDKTEVVNILADNYEHISSGATYSQNFRKQNI